MSKYQFHRLGSDDFQEMVQALLEDKRRDSGELIQFSSTGADGAREATWTQPPNHPTYIRPENSATDIPKRWIFQVKFHDIGLRGWAGAGAAVITDLKTELEKVTTKYNITCHHYVLITNVPLTGASRVGTRDKITRIITDWKKRIPSIEVWDASDLSRMLDNTPSVRTAYEELILPGDLLTALYRQLQSQSDRRQSVFTGYLKHLIDIESKARAEEADDDGPLPLSKVFIDQTLRLDKQSVPECYREDVEAWSSGYFVEDEQTTLVPRDLEEVSSGFPMLWGAHPKVMLLAGPGYGKSTITQFLTLYHASRIINPYFSRILAGRLKLPKDWTAEKLDSSCTIRLPFRVELRRYAKWRKTQTDTSTPVGIGSYIARQLIASVVESALNQDDIFSIISKNPTLLILDGLDEVPAKEDRDVILQDCDAFLYRCSGENVDLQIVMSSRPQGYHGEFDRFQPLRWIINDLNEADFYQYSGDWLTERVKNPEERKEAEERIRRGMASDAVRRLAITLLQSTVMLTIVRKKSDIPEERHKLFEKYVEVVFQREKTKNELIAKYEPELKLLHEMVGYQIHEAVARGEAGNMPEARFKDLVWNVWRLIRGDEKIHAVPNEEIQSIYDLSTDRLVFLSGKGTNQSDIDFLIQPYREYFAASYLANHSAADPDKIFKCLVEKGPYWQQVLRFYVAMAMAAQRISWALNASASETDECDVDCLAEGLSARRAVIFSLPEFGRLQFSQFRKIVSGCIPRQEWWTWLGQDWLIPITRVLRSGELWRTLWNEFKDKKRNSYADSHFALFLFPQVISRDSTEFNELLIFISESLENQILAPLAINAILDYDLPIEPSSANVDVLSAALKTFPFRRHLHHGQVISKMLQRVHRPVAARFLCTFSYRFAGMSDRDNLWALLDLPVKEPAIFGAEIETPSGLAIVVMPPAWLGFTIHGQLPLNPGANPLGVYEVYGRALFESLQEPLDADLHRKAALAMSDLPEQPCWALRIENVLGPSPDLFATDDAWKTYKNEVTILFAEEKESQFLINLAASFGSEAQNTRNNWTVFVIPPSHWERLLTAGLIDETFFEFINLSRWAKIARMNEALSTLNVSTEYSELSKSNLALPFLQIMQVAIETHNHGKLLESELITEIFSPEILDEIDITAFEELFSGIQKPESFPKTWACALVGIAISTKGMDVKLVRDFWSSLALDKRNSMWFNLMPHTNQGFYNSFLTELLDLKDDSALELLVKIASQLRTLSQDIAFRMNQLAVTELLKDGLSDHRRVTLLRVLVHSRPTIGEAVLYGNHNVFEAIIRSHPHMHAQIATRLTAMAQTFDKEDLVLLKTQIKRLVSKKLEYPPEITASAIDALIQVNVAICPPVSEKDWQTIS